MKEKQVVTKKLALEHKQAGKKWKGEILDPVIQVADYNRSYAARTLRKRAKPKGRWGDSSEKRFTSRWWKTNEGRGRKAAIKTAFSLDRVSG